MPVSGLTATMDAACRPGPGRSGSGRPVATSQRRVRSGPTTVSVRPSWLSRRQVSFRSGPPPPDPASSRPTSRWAAAPYNASRVSGTSAIRQAATLSRRAARGSERRSVPATAAILRASASSALRSAVRLCSRAVSPATTARQSSTDRAATSPRSTRAARAEARRSPSYAARPAVRNARSTDVSPLARPWGVSARTSAASLPNASTADSSWLPRYRAPGSRPRSVHVAAASVNLLCRRSSSRSASIHERNRGHAPMSASWARLTVSESAVNRRALSRSSSTCSAWSSPSMPVSSLRATGRPVSAVPPPGVTSRNSSVRAVRARTSSKPANRASAVWAIAPRTPPISSYAATVIVRPRRLCQTSSRACDISGSPPGSPSTSARIRAVNSRSTIRRSAVAGPTIACRSCSDVMGPRRRVEGRSARARDANSAHRP